MRGGGAASAPWSIKLSILILIFFLTLSWGLQGRLGGRTPEGH